MELRSDLMQEVEGRKLEPHLAYQLHFPLLLFLSFPSITHHHCVWELSVVSRYRPPPALFIIFSLSEHIISCCSFRKQRQSSELLFQRHTRIHSRNRNYRSISINIYSTRLYRTEKNICTGSGGYHWLLVM